MGATSRRTARGATPPEDDERCNFPDDDEGWNLPEDGEGSIWYVHLSQVKSDDNNNMSCC